MSYGDPCHVDLHTVQLPQDSSALHFLHGCGIPDEWIDFWRSTAMTLFSITPALSVMLIKIITSLVASIPTSRIGVCAAGLPLTT